MPKDPRYAYATCERCGREWQFIDWQCARHQLTCGYPIPQPEGAWARAVDESEWAPDSNNRTGFQRVGEANMHMWGFPSDFAAVKHFDAIANGPLCYKLNGNPNVQHYDPELRADEEARAYADSKENNSPRCVW